MIISLKLVHFPGSRLATRVPGGVTRRIPGYPPDQRGGGCKSKMKLPSNTSYNRSLLDRGGWKLKNERVFFNSHNLASFSRTKNSK